MLRVVSAVIVAHGQILMGLRSRDGDHPLLWETAGGKVEEGETDEQALIRELEEELGLKNVTVGPQVCSVVLGPPLLKCECVITYYHVTIPENTSIWNRVAECLAWYAPDELNTLDLVPSLVELKDEVIAFVKRLPDGN